MTSSSPAYELLYWPGIPGRGEFIRLAFELTHTSYQDTCNEQKDGVQKLTDIIASSKDASTSLYPLYAPPILRVLSSKLIIHQTPNILIYLSGKLGLDGGKDEASQAVARQIMFTALDLNNEAHDTHHPIAVMEYYEDQKDEALRKATDFRKNRLPKFFAYFEKALQANQDNGQGKVFVGVKASIADIAIWQVLDGLKFAFPKELAAREKEFPVLLGTFYQAFRELDGIKEYLTSERHLKYSHGVYRYYPELDRQD